MFILRLLNIFTMSEIIGMSGGGGGCRLSCMYVVLCRGWAFLESVWGGGGGWGGIGCWV